MRQDRHGRSAGEHCRLGAAVVEMALVSILLALLILGIVEVGRALHVYQVLESAAREGARKAVDIATLNDSEVIAAAKNYLAHTDIPSSDVTVTVSPSVNTTVNNTTDPPTITRPASGTNITVTTRVPYSKISYLQTTTWLKNKDLQAKVVMSRQ